MDVQNAYLFGVKFGVSYVPMNYLFFEFEYSFLKPDVDRTALTRGGNYYTAVEGGIKLHNLMFNAIAKYPAKKFIRTLA